MEPKTLMEMLFYFKGITSGRFYGYSSELFEKILVKAAETEASKDEVTK